MCQQTTVQAVKTYYTKFLEVWPSVTDLANAQQDEVMEAWAGLGYYARARNLHKCAKVIVSDWAGEFPQTQKELLELPGVGDYTSAAITAIAFNKPATVMDGNIERIISRLFLIKDPLPKSKPVFKEKAALLFKGFHARPGDLAQALMDIGSAICTPKSPKCASCPLTDHCKAQKKGVEKQLPVKIKAKKRPSKFGNVYWIENEKGEILFHKRPEKGLLGGMAGLPTSSWELVGAQGIEIDAFLNASASQDLNLEINHVFTHFDLSLKLQKGFMNSDVSIDKGYFWANHNNHKNALPTLFKKAYSLFQS